MFDTSPKDRIIAAALDLAAEKRWGDVELLEIAKKAGVTLPEFKELYSSKGDILYAFGRKLDEAVLAKAGADVGTEESARERLFDVLMTRFEMMTPYRTSLISICKDWAAGAGVKGVGQLLSSNYWMLNAAGISGEGPRGAVRVAGLAPLYAAVFPVWLNDEEAGLPKTMAALDKRLRAGENWMKRAENLCCAAREVLCCLRSPRSKSSAQATSEGQSAEAPAPDAGNATFVSPGPEPQGGAV